MFQTLARETGARGTWRGMTLGTTEAAVVENKNAAALASRRGKAWQPWGAPVNETWGDEYEQLMVIGSTFISKVCLGRQ